MTKQPKVETLVGVNVRVPARVHRAAKVACAAHGLTWDQAVTEALEAWVRSRTDARR
jgi:predicted HicB family RNase H-like nuclease